MKLFLTGGTGFIGSHFLKQALAAGHSVLALRRGPLRTPRIQLDQQPEWLDRSIEEVDASEMKGCNVLVHFAAHSVQYPFDTLATCLHWNLIAPLALFEKARQAGIHHFVVAGSCFEYGRSGERYDAIPADAPLEPTNSYASSKAAASIVMRQWAEEHKLSLVILRVFHVFGEGEPESRLWPSLRRAAWAGEDFPMTLGEQIRDFINVEDVAKFFLGQVHSIRESQQPFIEIRNLGGPAPQTIRAFSEYWWGLWGAKGKLRIGVLPYRPNEVMRFVAGNS
jgi:nucleoside-diphosphate-sugar epimerase